MTDFRKSQGAADAWVAPSDADLLVSQVIAEAWIRQVPPTSMLISQSLHEPWYTAGPSSDRFTVSQMLAEVWIRVPSTVGPPWHRASSQVI